MLAARMTTDSPCSLRNPASGTISLRDHVRIVPGFPKEGINFYDIATLMAHPQAWAETISQLFSRASAYKPDMVLGIESRGFLVGAPLALELGCSFGMIRKKGKLPGETLSLKYTLEYGADEIELQPDLLQNAQRILLVDDLMATGGSMHAAEQLVRKAGKTVAGALCIIELDGLKGREKLSCPFESLLLCAP